MKHLKVKIDKLEFDGEIVFKDIDFVLNEDDRVSIVGPNGAGKTSLLKVLIGENKNFDGFIENVGNLTLGYLHQVYSDDENKTVREELKDGFKEIINAEKELTEVEKDMAENPDDISLIETYTSLLERFNNIGGYDYNNKIHNVANGIGLIDLLDKRLVEVSGGQRTKIALAKVLLESPDILFLDEPTNFIDMAGVEWLESYLKNKWKGGYVIISHDREFLDKSCNKTFELQPKLGLELYHTNYSGYVLERDKVEKKKMEAWERQEEYIDKQENLINRFRAGSRAGWAKSREKMIDKMEKIDKPYIPKKPKFFFNELKDCPDKVLSFKEVFIGRNEPLFYINEAILHKGQRIGIVGENGVGKSTFLKTIIGQLDILDGYFVKGKSVEYVYYSQLHEELDKNKTVRENFIAHGIDMPDQHLIGLLNHYLFEKEDIDKKVANLSGGQTSKLLFAILGQKECNLLILDEPTNHLDYDTREAMEHALQKFKGAILFISHDRYFVNKLATNIWFITDGELSISYGNYEDYKFKLENGIDMDFNLFDEEAELNLVLEEKLSDRQRKRIKDKFGGGKKR
ncbi:MAG: ABC-F family ATP-binding cassette domain-containing protein [Candidatus Gracilibacteria bacterium]|nr:ABC-F family ATP-binding cassette domain-containing protein [Candidatus Gracilibacteria bacterium]